MNGAVNPTDLGILNVDESHTLRRIEEECNKH